MSQGCHSSRIIQLSLEVLRAMKIYLANLYFGNVIVRANWSQEKENLIYPISDLR